MDFLAKHYEKLILAACLVCLIWYISRVDAQESSESRATSDVRRTIGTLVRADKLLEAKEEGTLPTLNSMLTPSGIAANFTTSPNGQNKPGFLDYGSYIICKGKDCGYVLPYNTDECPECKTRQDAPAPETLPTDDLDKDGIPDLVEKELAEQGLNYRYPYDATEDFDGDGFTNYEEYLAGTEIDNSDSRPPLAHLLRLNSNTSYGNLAYILERVSDGGGSPNKADWKATFKYNGRSRAETLRLGEDLRHLAGYKLSEIRDDRLSVVITNESGSSYTLPIGKPVQEKSASIHLIYLRSHDRFARRLRRTLAQMQKPEPKMDENAMDMGMGGRGIPNRRMERPMNTSRGAMGGMGMENASNAEPLYVFTVKAGDNFLLELAPSGQGSSGVTFGGEMGSGNGEIEPILEYYRVLPSEGDEIRVQLLNGEGGEPVGEPIVIRALDTDEKLSKDFQRVQESRTENGMQTGRQPRRPMRR